MNPRPPTQEDVLRIAMGSPGFIAAMFHVLPPKLVMAVCNDAFARASNLHAAAPKPSDLPPALRQRVLWNN